MATRASPRSDRIVGLALVAMPSGNLFTTHDPACRFFDGVEPSRRRSAFGRNVFCKSKHLWTRTIPPRPDFMDVYQVRPIWIHENVETVVLDEFVWSEPVLETILEPAPWRWPMSRVRFFNFAIVCPRVSLLPRVKSKCR